MSPVPTSSRREIVRTRYWVQFALGVVFLLLFTLTLIVPDWIEEVFGVEPDQGNGTVEWIIVVACGVAAVCSFGLARSEWRRPVRLAAAVGRE